jgi:phosphinothricin acetyltransferase
MNPLYKIRLAGPPDAEAIRAIRNDVIAHSTAMWTTDPVTPAAGQAWLAENLARRSAYVAEAAGQVIGYANWAPWRPRDGYRHTVEDSVYLTGEHQGHGLGATLLGTLITGATDAGAHVMMACIESSNARSVTLHRRLGFELIGTAREVGTKFGRWLDLTMMHRPLEQPASPPAALGLTVRRADPLYQGWRLSASCCYQIQGKRRSASTTARELAAAPTRLGDAGEAWGDACTGLRVYFTPFTPSQAVHSVPCALVPRGPRDARIRASCCYPYEPCGARVRSVSRLE